MRLATDSRSGYIPCVGQASLYYTAHKLFSQVTTMKPVTSRPASSERYTLSCLHLNSHSFFTANQIYAMHERYMVCKGFTKSLQASEHLLSLLERAAKDEKDTITSGESTSRSCASQYLSFGVLCCAI